MQVHLLDATYELFRAHFGRPPAIDVQGRPVGATLGLVESVLGLLRDPAVTHVGCATDHVIRSWRNERYEGYKTEAGMPAELLAQFERAESALRALGLVVWPMTEYEADDALATAAARWADAPGVERVVILSPDKDLAQCVRADGRVIAFDRRRQRTIDADAVRSRFGVEPESIPDWLALVGDAADGFPGLRGWGERSASAVLARFGHLEAIPADVRDWGVPLRNAGTLAATLRAGRAEAELYRDLATLRLDVPLSETLEALTWRGAPRGEFAGLVEELRAPHLAARVPRWAD
ncbi:MAG TPA: 5'-3' exonuclease H3TH domain-containing protein [Candidatus Acidoferrales bacterium]|nr:5'-3' exonuclease H3TH domain-containing protein [Candidatus Acidoferrales bacterium]